MTNSILLETITLDVTGMKCAGCVKSVERQLAQEDGVISASVNLITSVALVEYQPLKIIPENLAQRLSSRGFPSQVRKSENISMANLQALAREKKQRAKNQQIWQLITAALLLVLSSIGHLHHLGLHHIPVITNIWFHWSLATLALLIPGRGILLDGWQGLWHFNPNMNSLVALGTISSYLTSCIALIFPSLGWECFFDEPVMLLGFIFLGRVLESRARGKASESLEALLTLRPPFARLVGKVDTNEDQGLSIPVEQIRLNEWVRVLPGEKIPVDGKIIQGESTIDESLLTGESMPVTKKPNDMVTGGTINYSDVLIVETTRTGINTTLNQIVATVEEAQNKKAPVQKLTDTVAGYFCYGVMIIALLTFLFWYFIGGYLFPASLIFLNTSPLLLSLKLAIAVLVIACPCALGLATPTAILVGTTIGAEKGLLIKGGDVLEKVKNLTTIIFDKTGTITQGYPQITDIITLNNTSTEEILQLAGSLEKYSLHPLAEGILSKVQKLELSLLPTEEIIKQSGEGISGIVIKDKQSLKICLGNENWLTSQSISIPEDIKFKSEQLGSQGQTVIYISKNKELIGLISFFDQIRPDAQKTVEEMQKLGLDVILLSGDRQIVVKKIAEKIGIKNYHAQINSQNKANFIKNLQSQNPNLKIAMIGDGVNDAPALAQADLGIAMAKGAQISVETADIVLTRGKLLDIIIAIKLSNATLTKIKQNLAWALGYNLITIPIAAGILFPFYHLVLSPALAGGLMAFSSIMVVSNSVFLRKQFKNN